MKSKESLEDLFDLLCEREHTNSEHSFWLKLYQIVEKDLEKPQELYNKIKEKRDNARLIREEHTRKQDISDEEKSEIYAEICSYNEVLSLMESMFEVLKNEKL